VPTMKYDSWTTKSSDGRTVEFAYKELSDGVAGVSAKTDLLSVMVIQRSIRAPLTRKQVERIFEHDGRPTRAESFDFDAERTKVSAMTMSDLIEHCKDCAVAVKARPASEVEWENWFRLGIAKEEWHRREWAKTPPV
jgi:hypothetical protein